MKDRQALPGFAAVLIVGLGVAMVPRATAHEPIVTVQATRPAKPGFPATPEGEWLVEYLQAHNSGELDTILNYAEAIGEAPGYLYSLYLEAGPLEFAVLDKGAYWFRGSVTECLMGLVIRPGGESAFEIGGVRRGLRPAGVPYPKALDANEFPSYLEAYLDASTAGGHFSGAMLMAKDGETIFQHGYGLADRANDVANTVETAYRLASVTKMFVGVAIAQLAQQGELSFQDPISKFIPEYPPHIGDQVTVHHLLTHTSGIELDNDPDYNQAAAQAESLEELLSAQVRYIKNLNLGNYENFKPLERFDYTNEGIDLLGIIIQRTSGMDWRDYMQENIFEPAGMTKTGLVDAESDVPGMAKGYSVQSGNQRVFSAGPRQEVSSQSLASTAVGRIARPAGSGYSTILDLQRFVSALLDNRLLDEAHTKLILSPQILVAERSDMKRSYGYTFQVNQTGDLIIIGHSGGAYGMATVLDIYPDQGYTVIVLSNFDRMAAHNVAAHIGELIGGRRLSIASCRECHRRRFERQTRCVGAFSSAQCR